MAPSASQASWSRTAVLRVMEALGAGGTERAAVMLVDHGPPCVAEARAVVLGGLRDCTDRQIARALVASCMF